MNLIIDYPEDFIRFSIHTKSKLGQVNAIRVPLRPHIHGADNVFEAWRMAKSSFIKHYKWWDWI